MLASPFASEPSATSATRPSVLVGITTRNRAAILPTAIRSALSQDYPSVQVAVLDDGSDDETPSLRLGFPGVEWHRWDSVRGYMEARNYLMRTAQADYYLSLDDDAWFLSKDEISLAVGYLERNKRVAAVAYDILTPEHSQPSLRTVARPTHMFVGCGHVLRVSAARESGLYESSPGSYGSEEIDLCLRLLDRGWETHLLPGTHVWHDRTNQARDLAAQHRSGVCNDLVFALRRCPFPMVSWVLPAKVLHHVVFSRRHALLKTCIAGFGLCLRNLRPIWASRQPVSTRTFKEFMRRSRGIQ